MDVTNIERVKDWFEVLQTSERSQTAMMTLASDQSSGKKAEAHEKSDQVLLILDGEIDWGSWRSTSALKKRRHDNYSSRRETLL
jgi:mannose-6-phosphate isomerase-like protein (cupin superfamily)